MERSGLFSNFYPAFIVGHTPASLALRKIEKEDEGSYGQINQTVLLCFQNEKESKVQYFCLNQLISLLAIDRGFW